MSDTPTIFEEFRQECRELLEGIEQVLRRMDCEQASPEDCSLLRRRFHSVKGGATFAGADGITRLTHEMEDLLDELEVGPMPPEILRALWTCHDAIHQALERPEDAPPSPEPTRRQPAPVPAPVPGAGSSNADACPTSKRGTRRSR